jgi:uncharacterized protein YwgA
MYYRRKILLSLIQLTGSLEKIKIQKLLFLISNRQVQPLYHFVPYKYGCFSFQANADLSTLCKYGILDETDNNMIVKSKVDYLKQLDASDREILHEIVGHYSMISNDDIIKHTYLQYPFYAIKSTIAKKILKNEEYNKVIESMPVSYQSTLFTIGY